MMQGGIYLLQKNGQLVDMKAQTYDSEALLQEFLATYPTLLPGDQIDRDVPRRWLLITREAPVPADDDGVGRWEEAEVACKILDWAHTNQLRIWWGKGRKDGSFSPYSIDRGTPYWLIPVWTSGLLEVQFQMMQTKPPFSVEAKRLELLHRLNTILGVEIPPDGMTRRPSIELSVLKDGAALGQFLEALDCAIQEVRAS